MPLYPEINPLASLYIATVDAIVEASHNLAAKYAAQNEQFASLPIETYLAFLNGDIPSTQQRLGARDATAAVINAQLDAVVAERPDLAALYIHRVPTGIGRAGVSYNGAEYIYTAPDPE